MILFHSNVKICLFHSKLNYLSKSPWTWQPVMIILKQIKLALIKTGQQKWELCPVISSHLSLLGENLDHMKLFCFSPGGPEPYITVVYRTASKRKCSTSRVAISVSPQVVWVCLRDCVSAQLWLFQLFSLLWGFIIQTCICQSYWHGYERLCLSFSCTFKQAFEH